MQFYGDVCLNVNMGCVRQILSSGKKIMLTILWDMKKLQIFIEFLAKWMTINR